MCCLSRFLNEAQVPVPHPFVLPRSLSFPSVSLSADCVRFVSHNLVRPWRASLFIPSEVTLGHCAAVHFGQRDWRCEREGESNVNDETPFRGRQNKVLLAKHIRHKTQILTGFLDWWNMISGSLSPMGTRLEIKKPQPQMHSLLVTEQGTSNVAWSEDLREHFPVSHIIVFFSYLDSGFYLYRLICSELPSFESAGYKTALGWSCS